MTDVSRTTRKQAMQIAVLIAGTLVTFNTGFYFLSALYLADSTDAVRDGIRIAFAEMSGIIALAAFTAALAPRALGHGLAAALGLASIVAGCAAIAHDMPP